MSGFVVPAGLNHNTRAGIREYRSHYIRRNVASLDSIITSLLTLKCNDLHIQQVLQLVNICSLQSLEIQIKNNCLAETSNAKRGWQTLHNSIYNNNEAAMTVAVGSLLKNQFTAVTEIS